jgi:methylated-DNA-[protein]-cysteine S-methyltransferase
MTPPLTFQVGETPLGWVAIAASDRGLYGVTLPAADRAAALGRLELELGPAPVGRDEEHGALEAIRAFLGGSRRSLDLPLDLRRGTAFQREVWAATRTIPYGETRSYKWVAEEIGRPAAARAVGQALGSNPLALVVPCHRVIGSDGGLTGFGSAGLPMKRRLLDLERGYLHPIGEG